MFLCVNQTTECHQPEHCNRNVFTFSPLNADLNPTCQLLVLLGAHHILHVSRVRVKHTTQNVTQIYRYVYDLLL